MICSLGNELTWSSSGTIFIDGISIPDSNIFQLFPYLFRAKRPKDLIGFDDFTNKIIEMGLNDFIYKKPKTYQAKVNPTTTSKSDQTKDVDWWFLD